MVPVVRRTIDELVTLYELEPEIRDLFVEGASDRVLFLWYLRHRCRGNYSVQDISTIDVPPEVIEKNAQDNGNRGRIISLAYELDERLSGVSRNCVTLVYDSDFDRVLGVSQKCDLLLTTDFSCVEMYLFNELVICKLLSLVLMGCDYSSQHVISELEKVLVRLFLIRLCNHLLGLQMSWIDFIRVCENSAGIIIFNEAELIKPDFDTCKYI
jgi:hypothetical protein